MSDRVEAGFPANNSGAMYRCVPVGEGEPSGMIVWVNPARVIPANASSETTCPIPKSVSFTASGEWRVASGEWRVTGDLLPSDH